MGTSDVKQQQQREEAPNNNGSPTSSSTASDGAVDNVGNVVNGGGGNSGNGTPSPPDVKVSVSTTASGSTGTGGVGGRTTTIETTTVNAVVEDDDDDEYQILIVPSDVDDEDDEEDGNGNGNGNVRIGSISSARFNILSTMVGGGCLSLPLAFQQSGNALTAPLLLILTGLLTDFCFRLLVTISRKLNPPHTTRPGKDSFESITSEAFGPKAYIMSMGLVTLMCFFGAVGYSVLLRDMMEPINDMIFDNVKSIPKFVIDNDWIHKNLTLFLVILIVTPATTLQTFTALKNCGAASMMSILVLGSCIVIRSIQCNMNNSEQEQQPWYKYLKLWPESSRELLDAVPLYISCFVCHYNILPVHNELQNPTPSRVSWWLRSTTWFSVVLYMIMGFAGSTYGHCTPTGKVQGNVLLDFDEHDPLLMVGRMCLALTITLAFPMLVIPARDIMLRSIILPWLAGRRTTTTTGSSSSGRGEEEYSAQAAATLPPPITPSSGEELQEPLLLSQQDHNVDDAEQQPTNGGDSEEGNGNMSSSFLVRLLTSIVIFWTAGTVASVCESIDIVWDLLGSSLSILLSYLIPCGSYLVIMRDEVGHFWSKLLCWILILFFVPLMFISTGNAIDNTFFHH